MKTTLRHLILAIVLAMPAPAENQADAAMLRGELRRSGLPDGGKPVTVPLESTFLGLVAKVEINGRIVPLVVDTGAAGLILTPETAKELGLEVHGEVTGIGILGEKFKAGKAVTRRVVVGGAWTEHEPAMVTSFPFKLAGLIGIATFADWDLRIDPARKTLTIFPAGTAPAMEGEIRLPLSCEVAQSMTGTPNPVHFRLINLRIPVRAAGQQLMAVPDTGFGGVFQLSKQFMERNAPDSMKHALPALRTGSSISGSVISRTAKLPELAVGSEIIRELSTDVVDAAPGSNVEKMGVMGLNILRHYVMTFRFAAGELRLKPLGTVNELARSSTAGLFMEHNAEGQAIIRDLVPDGPGAKAGLRTGDELFEIEGHPLKTMSPEEFAAFKQLPPGTSVKVRCRRGNDAPFECVLILVKE